MEKGEKKIMGDGLKRVAKQCGGITVSAGGKTVRYDGDGNKIDEPPYIIVERVEIDKKYNPNYGDDRICVCGHPYVRHFDPFGLMEPMEAVGCKYCGCYEFKEAMVDSKGA